MGRGFGPKDALGGLSMFELDALIAEQLTEVSLNSAVQVRCGNSNSFVVTASTMLPLIQSFGMGGVYISASRGAVEIIQAFESIGVDVSNIQFLDLVSSVFWAAPTFPTRTCISSTAQSCSSRSSEDLVHPPHLHL